MPEESQPLDPYDLVLLDLRAQRSKIDIAIQAIESLRGISPSVGTVTPPSQGTPVSPEGGRGAFLGMTIVEAAKAILSARRQTVTNSEFAEAFKAGGLVLSSADPINTVGSVLTRRFHNIGDVVRIGRGEWGLAEWYPNRNFKKKAGKEEPGMEPSASFPEPTLADIRSAAEMESNARASRMRGIDELDPWAVLDDPSLGKGSFG
jgi:hypothetical protein